jgi:4-carboxymuconolactone decarboxylase
MSRIAPVAAPYSDALQQRLARVVPEGLKPPRIYRIVARNESLFLNLVDTGVLGLTGLFDRGVLPTRLRDLLILRTCVAAGNDYEWRLHVDPGLSTHMGLSDAEIADTRNDTPDTDLWTHAERAAIELAGALVRHSKVDDGLYGRLREHYDEPTLIEMTQLVGWYTIVAMQVALAALHPKG